MIKLKKLLKESSPGFTKREFGDPLPTFKDVMEKHQQIDEDFSKEYRLRTRSGTGVPKKTKVEIHKSLDKVWKKFRSLGGGYVETASEDRAPYPTYYVIKYQVARRQKSGKHRDWLYLKLDKKYNVEIQPKGRKDFKAGNLKNPNKVAKILNQWSDENLDFS